MNAPPGGNEAATAEQDIPGQSHFDE